MADLQKEADEIDMGINLDELRMDQVFQHLDVDSLDQETLQELASKTGLSSQDIRSVLAGQVDQEQVEHYLQKEQAQFDTRTLKHTDFIQNTGGPSIKDSDNTFRKTKYKLI